jgi:hypothetical protein
VRQLSQENHELNERLKAARSNARSKTGELPTSKYS